MPLRRKVAPASFPAMPNPHDDPAALKELQDSIYREKVLRARAMSPGERFDTGFELTGEVFRRMLAGALSRLGSSDERAGWQEVEKGLERLRKVHDHGRYSAI
jgi:hypothetical protein